MHFLPLRVDCAIWRSEGNHFAAPLYGNASHAPDLQEVAFAGMLWFWALNLFPAVPAITATQRRAKQQWRRSKCSGWPRQQVRLSARMDLTRVVGPIVCRSGAQAKTAADLQLQNRLASSYERRLLLRARTHKRVTRREWMRA